ncbi:hypothetical protein CYMTET_29705 [Cymbomonas tetramitiformis]|uniref:Uncharacterized protein n=1 Tax=Cymbomonas tetramitiformis TaxID=36881 RepID=A0AAE0FKI1_9CHLO|nr:hypothetical protein CYMTET_29705 [Cymbomonas tetramitiformis]
MTAVGLLTMTPISFQAARSAPVTVASSSKRNPLVHRCKLGVSLKRPVTTRRNVMKTNAIMGGLDAESKPKLQRIVMTPDLWIRHRGPNRFWRHISTLPESSVLSNLFPAIAFFTGLSTVVWYSTVSGSTDIPDLTLPKGSLGPVTAFLGLLLVFRTNQSYDRWWEARKIWGGMLNRTRDYAVQGLTWFDEKDLDLKKQHVRYTQAFALALKVHLRSDEDMKKELTGVLTGLS